MTIADDWLQLGIGDLSLRGWVTVFAYFVTAFLVQRVLSHRPRRSGSERLGSGTDDAYHFWLFTFALMVLLGINKQLDLQSLITAVGRDFARSQGWYENRRSVQWIFVVGLGAAALASVMSILFLQRRVIWRAKGAFFGLTLLAAFIILRAAKFHHVELLGAWVANRSWVLELGGIALVALSAMFHILDQTRGHDGAAGKPGDNAPPDYAARRS